MTGTTPRPTVVRISGRRATVVLVVALTALVSACSSATAGAGWTLGPSLPPPASASPGPASAAPSCDTVGDTVRAAIDLARRLRFG